MMAHPENIALVCGFIFLLAALVMKVFPPRKINAFYGYRTATSARSQQHWDFAQHYSTLRTIEAGLFLIVVGIIVEMVPMNPKIRVAVGFIALFAVPIYLFARTERALKKKFPK